MSMTVYLGIHKTSSPVFKVTVLSPTIHELVYPKHIPLMYHDLPFGSSTWLFENQPMS